MEGGGGGVGLSMMERRGRGVFRSLLCVARGPGTPPPTRYDAAPCRGCLVTYHDPYAARAEAFLVTLSATTMSAVGGRGWCAHKYEKINRITLGKSVLIDFTIYVLCRVVAWWAAAVVTVGKGTTTENKENQKWWSADCNECRLRWEYQIFEWKDLQRGVGRPPANNAYLTPFSLCRTLPLLCTTRWYLRTYGQV